jgi:hypothetical protein
MDYVAEKDAKKAELDQLGVVTASLPKVWIGYFFVFAKVLILYIEITIDPNSVEVPPEIWFIDAAGCAYWLFCVHRMHQILKQFTNGTYPISPSKAVVFHLIPFFHFYWAFKWTSEVSNFVNKRGEVKSMSKKWPGFFLFITFFLGVVEYSLAIIAMFTVGLYINKKIRRVVELGHGNSVTSGPNNPTN